MILQESQIMGRFWKNEGPEYEVPEHSFNDCEKKPIDQINSS